MSSGWGEEQDWATLSSEWVGPDLATLSSGWVGQDWATLSSEWVGPDWATLSSDWVGPDWAASIVSCGAPCLAHFLIVWVWGVSVYSLGAFNKDGFAVSGMTYPPPWMKISPPP